MSPLPHVSRPLVVSRRTLHQQKEVSNTATTIAAMLLTQNISEFKLWDYQTCSSQMPRLAPSAQGAGGGQASHYLFASAHTLMQSKRAKNNKITTRKANDKVIIHRNFIFLPHFAIYQGAFHAFSEGLLRQLGNGVLRSGEKEGRAEEV